MKEKIKPSEAKEASTSKDWHQQIENMTVAEKVEVAMTCGRETRSVLIRDSNKQVQAALLESSRITEAEIVAIASSPTLSEELLRKIVGNKQWLKNYQIRLALVKNPNTPLPISLRILTTLRNGDLKQLAKSNEVSDELVLAAQRSTKERSSIRTQSSEEEEKPKSRFQEIKDLPVPEKMKLAMTGDKEVRSILVKDANKLVQEAVLDSPRITEAEVVAVANSRSIADELLRKIAGKRVWMKNYQLRVALVNNPKTPLPTALKILPTLMAADLKRLTMNRGVSNVLVSSAQRFLIKKQHR
jgi:prophage DNA circulation protein